MIYLLVKCTILGMSLIEHKEVGRKYTWLGIRYNFSCVLVNCYEERKKISPKINKQQLLTSAGFTLSCEITQ